MRRYAGKWHRFVQPDPSEGSYDMSNPQSFNRYAYVQNDPVNFIDPLGLDPNIDIGTFFAGDVVAEQGMVGTFGFDGELGMVITPKKPEMPEPQNPATVKNATPDQQNRFNDAFNELWKRLHANDGKNSCANLFGGIKNAEKALKNTNFNFGSTKNPGAWAETLGKNITIASDKGFMNTSGSVTFQVGFDLSRAQAFNISLDNVQSAAFILLHELGHRTGTLNPDGNDPFGFVSVINNGKVRDACFSDIPTTIAPLQ